MPEFEHDGWRLAFDDRGEGPTVLLVHGLLFDATQLAPQVEALSDRYHLVTPDLRAHGRSEHRQADYDQWDLMEDHVALLDHLGIERAVWGGVSQGGFQSLRAALKHADRVAGLVLIDTQAGPEDETRAPMFEASAQVAAESGWNEDLLGIATTFLFGESADEDLRRRWIDRWMARDTFDAVEFMRAVTRREDISDRLADITAPAIVIHGEEEVAIEMEKARALADGLGDEVEFVTVPGAGHSSPIERPDEVTAAIERFLGAGVAGLSGSARTRHARRLFAGIAPEYDFMAELLSFGQNGRWRRFMVSRLRAGSGSRVLDVATGTAGVAVEIARRTGARVVGLDQSPEMLAGGRRSVAAAGVGERVSFVLGQGERLPFPDGTFDAVTFTYLLRYVDDPPAALRELARVLRPGGTLANLEFLVPPNPAWRAAWVLYTRVGLPVGGLVASREWWATGRFLGPSISGFYRRYPLAEQGGWWREAGISPVRYRPMSLGGGIVIWGTRASNATAEDTPERRAEAASV